MQRYLYKARTNDKNMFAPAKEKEKNFKTHFHVGKKMKLELSKHHSIILAPLDKFRLFVAQNIDIFFCKSCWKRKNKFMKFYEEGVAKIENDLNVFKLLSNVRTMKVMLQNQNLTEEVKHHIQHSKKNLIWISSSESSSSDISISDDKDDSSEKDEF